MRNLDETDMEILRLLAEDGRRAYSDIGESVGLSAPAVSDRINRLREQDVIRRFTVDIDRSKLRGGTAVLVDLRPDPTAVEATRAALAGTDAVERLYTTAEGRLVCHARIADGDARSWLGGAVDLERVREVDVTLLSTVEETGDGVAGTRSEFAIACDECGNTVTEEGVTTRVGGDLRQFCCPSCDERYRERYERLRDGADG